MRKLGGLNDREQAQLFGSFLFSMRIENQLEEQQDGSWLVWIHSEDRLNEARRLFSEFLEDPSSRQFSDGAVRGRQMLEAEQARESDYRRNYHDRQKILSRPSAGFITIFCILVSIAVSLLSGFGTDDSVTNRVLITPLLSIDGVPGFARFLPEVRHGQVWRLVSPIFLHLDPVHLLFNMLWMFELGRIFERKHGSLFLTLFVGLVAVFPNILQFIFHGPSFGGMSGVVYGLLGFFWMRAKADPFYDIHLNRTTVWMMLVWLFLCMTPLISAANYVHAGGLLGGLAVGFLSGRYSLMTRSR